MSPPPRAPKVYHITHVDNLASIITDGCVWSDAERPRRVPEASVVGMAEIKQRRLESLPVSCHPDTKVGEYVPFYLCPRSIMLYVIYCRNHPELVYRGGQDPILHLEADLHETIAWADGEGVRWAFTTSNAGAYATLHFSDASELDKVDWQAVSATDFRSASIREGKQAEFLLHERLPLHLVQRIGVKSEEMRARVKRELAVCDHKSLVETRPKWYY